jgi:hypothetical protein
MRVEIWRTIDRSWAHHYRFQHITFFDLTTWNCFFDGDLDDVAYACVATVRATQNLDTHYATCTGVVGDVQLMRSSTRRWQMK